MNSKPKDPTDETALFEDTASNRLLRDVIDGLEELVFVKDIDGRYILTNPAFDRALAGAGATALGRADGDYFGPEAVSYFREQDLGVVESGKRRLIDEVVEIHGVPRNFRTTKAPYSGSDGKAAGIIGVARDVTEQMRASEALLARADHQQTLAELGQLALRQGELPALIRTTTERVARSLGITTCGLFELDADFKRLRYVAGIEEPGTEARARDAANCVHLEKPGPADCGFAAPRSCNSCAADGVSASGLCVLVQLGDRPFGVFRALAPAPREFTADERHLVQSAANLLALAIQRRSAEDALRASEEQLRHSQKMEAVGQLAGGVAHDFNNLLTVIGGYTDFMSDGFRPEDPAYQDLAVVRQAVTRAASLTRQLLAFSRRQVLQPRVFDLNVAVRDMEKMLRRLIGEDIALRTEPAEDLWRVVGDPTQVEQVLLNLVVNARDAMPHGGSLVVSTSNVTMTADVARRSPGMQPGEHVLLRVADTGCGIPRELHARIFDPFFTTKEKGKGTGLGLSTVYGIVKQTGGYIGVESEPGRGTTFQVYLPRAPEGAREAPVETPETTPQSGRGTVLLVEDEDSLRILCSRVLRRQGYEVLEARHGGEALLLCERHSGHLHLLLTDVIMPGMSGPELARRLTALRPAMKVLFMSGYTDDALLAHGAAGDSIDLLNKPYTAAGLLEKVRKVLRNGGP
ncbi:MAG: response regulator [Candidatus Wallbacteria bacterium]|nr:response regulator [Candidatus Wallbacteria bacterium]